MVDPKWLWFYSFKRNNKLSTCHGKCKANGCRPPTIPLRLTFQWWLLPPEGVERSAHVLHNKRNVTVFFLGCSANLLPVHFFCQAVSPQFPASHTCKKRSGTIIVLLRTHNMGMERFEIETAVGSNIFSDFAYLILPCSNMKGGVQ